jgi:hypothetical protein
MASFIYKVTKIKSTRDYDWRTGKYDDEWTVTSRRVDYRVRQSDVTSAINYAKQYHGKYHKYDVIVEVAEYPEFETMPDW